MSDIGKIVPTIGESVEAIAVNLIQNSLTKREQIAAMALQGLLAHDGHDEHPDAKAGSAVHHADALLAELAKDGEA